MVDAVSKNVYQLFAFYSLKYAKESNG